MQFVTVLIFAQLTAFASGKFPWFNSNKSSSKDFLQKKPKCKDHLKTCEEKLQSTSNSKSSLLIKISACNEKLKEYEKTRASDNAELKGSEEKDTINMLQTQPSKTEKEPNTLKELEEKKKIAETERIGEEAEKYLSRATPPQGAITQRETNDKQDKISTPLSKQFHEEKFDHTVPQTDFRTYIAQRAQKNLKSMAGTYNLNNAFLTELQEKIVDDAIDYIMPQLKIVKAKVNEKVERINTLETLLAVKDVQLNYFLKLARGQSSSQKQLLDDLERPITIIKYHHTREELIEKLHITNRTERNITTIITKYLQNECENEKKDMLNKLNTQLQSITETITPELNQKDEIFNTLKTQLAQKDVDNNDLPKGQSRVHHYTEEFNIIKTITQKCKNEHQESNKIINELKKELIDVYSQLSLKDAELAKKDFDSNDLPKGQSNEHPYTEEELIMIKEHNITTVKEFNIIKTITQQCKNEQREERNKMLNKHKQELADTQYQLFLKEFELEVKDADQSSLQKQLSDQLKRPTTIIKHHHTREELIKELNITTVKELRITETIIKYVKEECQEEKNDILNSRAAEAPSAPAGPSTEAAEADSPAATEAATHDAKKKVKKGTNAKNTRWEDVGSRKFSSADKSELVATGRVRNRAEKDKDEKEIADRRVKARTNASETSRKSTTATRKQTSIDVE